ncbi:hypothetical protein Q4524_19950 [Alteromonas stellipolaris]|nr:hypothetical protein [Alteromonas stellipolaris]MCQ8850718.1 hypothetical protein [Alteromonas stellipolaris]MDO6540868.1 hypothetical protein [Alteromonas stellipolaris]
MKKLSLTILVSTLISGAAIASDQTAKFDASFSSLDSDGNELLASQELDGTSLAAYINDIDTNGDSSINLSEFNQYAKANPDKFSEDVIASVNENSVEDAVSKQKVATAENSDMVSAVIANFEKADTNKDGTLSSTEVSKANMDGNFSEMDTDGNDALSKVELENYLKQKASR